MREREQLCDFWDVLAVPMVHDSDPRAHILVERCPQFSSRNCAVQAAVCENLRFSLHAQQGLEFRGLYGEKAEVLIHCQPVWERKYGLCAFGSRCLSYRLVDAGGPELGWTARIALSRATSPFPPQRTFSSGSAHRREGYRRGARPVRHALESTSHVLNPDWSG